LALMEKSLLSTQAEIMLNSCREKIKLLNLPVEFSQGDAHHYPCATAIFDGARMDRTLQHHAMIMIK
jgi:ubiquinone/menaquinone biosynthesis C-methylase UbiE